jgi:hypothetical protein
MNFCGTHEFLKFLQLRTGVLYLQKDVGLIGPTPQGRKITIDK